MKKSLNLNGAKILKIAVVLLIMTMITGILVSNTVAKYTTSFTGSDTARVAKFSVSATGITAGAVDLFQTSYGSSSVVTSTDNVVAPGTAGSISISFTNNSEVPIALSGATLSETNIGSIPIVYSLDNVTYYAAGNSTLNSALSSAISGTLAAGASMGSPVVVYWKWVFYVDASGDVADTALGLAGTAQVTTTVAVTATQVASA